MIFPLLVMMAVCGLSVPSLNAQTGQVAGTVVDAGTGLPVAGAVVQVKGTSKGCETDLEGRFRLDALSSDDVLVVSCLGYESQETGWNGRHDIEFVLKEDRELLDEVVVVGYGTMDKKELTSAIAHVSSKDFLTTAGGDPSMLIQGKVAGVSVVNTGAADPNNEASIQIRGISSRTSLSVPPAPIGATRGK